MRDEDLEKVHLAAGVQSVVRSRLKWKERALAAEQRALAADTLAAELKSQVRGAEAANTEAERTIERYKMVVRRQENFATDLTEQIRFLERALDSQDEYYYVRREIAQHRPCFACISNFATGAKVIWCAEHKSTSFMATSLGPAPLSPAALPSGHYPRDSSELSAPPAKKHKSAAKKEIAAQLTAASTSTDRDGRHVPDAEEEAAVASMTGGSSSGRRSPHQASVSCSSSNTDDYLSWDDEKK